VSKIDGNQYQACSIVVLLDCHMCLICHYFVVMPFTMVVDIKISKLSDFSAEVCCMCNLNFSQWLGLHIIYCLKCFLHYLCAECIFNKAWNYQARWLWHCKSFKQVSIYMLSFVVLPFSFWLMWHLHN